MERTDGCRFDQALSHAARGRGTEFEIEVAEFTLENLRVRGRADYQAYEQ
jgi:hypothetical protein